MNGFQHWTSPRKGDGRTMLQDWEEGTGTTIDRKSGVVMRPDQSGNLRPLTQFELESDPQLASFTADLVVSRLDPVRAVHGKEEDFDYKYSKGEIDEQEYRKGKEQFAAYRNDVGAQAATIQKKKEAAERLGLKDEAAKADRMLDKIYSSMTEAEKRQWDQYKFETEEANKEKRLRIEESGKDRRFAREQQGQGNAVIPTLGLTPKEARAQFGDIKAILAEKSGDQNLMVFMQQDFESLGPKDKQVYVQKLKEFSASDDPDVSAAATRGLALARGLVSYGGGGTVTPGGGQPGATPPPARQPQAAPQGGEGTIAKNPQTGEMLILQGGVWKPYNGK